VRRFFSSETGARVIGAGCGEFVITTMLPTGTPTSAAWARGRTVAQSGTPPF
jgi:hypothetical protein